MQRNAASDPPPTRDPGKRAGGRRATDPPWLHPSWHYHFLGIGGVGMSALAAILHERRFRVSGSDAHESEALQRLNLSGVPVTLGHDPAALRTADAVVYSSAIGRTHPIWAEVARLRLPCYHRAEVLGALAAARRTVAVTGTHGKTTCTGALAQVLTGAGRDPTVVLGGHMAQLGGANYRNGAGYWMVCEADESDGSFIYLAPEAVLLTNVEADHLDHHGSLDNLVTAFEDFLGRLRPEGVLVYCCDDTLAARLGRSWPGQSVAYGSGRQAEMRVHVDSLRTDGMSLRLRCGSDVWRLETPLSGRHNAVNLCGAFATARAVGVPETAALEALAGYTGVARRQQFVGEVDGVYVYDDYAHHPTEVRAVLEQFLATHGEPVTVVFQPHLYSRTAYFADAFAAALRPATRVYVTEVYGAREQPMAGVSGRMIVERLNGHPAAYFQPDWADMAPLVRDGVVPRGVLLTLGAGDVTGLGPLLLGEARSRER